MAIILASQSPRRRELLGLLQLPFTVRTADIDETMDKTKSVADAVADLSRRKAEAIPRQADEIVIGADTIVVLGDRVLGKPKDPEDAVQMLRSLSGRQHQVMTGLTVLQGNRCISVTEVTEVTFRELTDREIRDYVDSKDPMDKAGSYGIQSGGARFVSGICGDFYNVMGLPVCRLDQILKAFTEEAL